MIVIARMITKMMLVWLENSTGIAARITIIAMPLAGPSFGTNPALRSRALIGGQGWTAVQSSLSSCRLPRRVCKSSATRIPTNRTTSVKPDVG